MVNVLVTELVRDVRISLDENAAESVYLSGNSDNLELDEIIRLKLPEAAREVTETCEVGLLEPVVMGTTVTADDGGGVLTIPDDFLRLVFLKMKGWNRGVSVVAGEGSDTDLIQRNRYTRGTATKPVCVYGHDANGGRVIEYFGKGSVVEKALYMPLPAITGSGTSAVLSLSRLLRDAIVKRTAELVAEARRAEV